MLYCACVALLAGQAAALRIGGASTHNLPSRRELLTRFAAAVPVVAVSLPSFAGPVDGKQDGKATDEWGSAVTSKALKSPFEQSQSPGRRAADVRLAGKYTDPNHPGGYRKLTLVGTNKVIVNGADEDGVPFTVKGTYEGNTVTLDFSPKGGPKDAPATYSLAKGLTFADGNTWSKGTVVGGTRGVIGGSP